MKKLFMLAALLALAGAAFAQGNKMDITVTIGGTPYAAVFEDNAVAREVASRFPLALSMSEWAGNSEYYARLSEKVGAGGVRSPAKFETGDLALYNGISLVIFYAATTNTSGYVRLGHIADADGLKSALDSAKDTVTFAKADGTARTENDSAREIEAIQERYRAMYRAMIAKDMAAMAELHALKFVLIHMTGAKMNQKKYLAAVKDGTLNYYSADHDDISVKVDGNRATLCGKSRVNAAVYGGGTSLRSKLGKQPQVATHTWRLQQDMTLEKIGGVWKFTHSQASTY